MRNEALPRENWPCKILDDSTEKRIIECLELGRQAGFNQLDVFGLFATDSYRVDIMSAFADKQRKTRVNRILKAARERGIQNIFGLGVYRWGFDDIIKSDPSVRGPNLHAMCGSAPESFRPGGKPCQSATGQSGGQFRLHGQQRRRSGPVDPRRTFRTPLTTLRLRTVNENVRTDRR